MVDTITHYRQYRLKQNTHIQILHNILKIRLRRHYLFCRRKTNSISWNIYYEFVCKMIYIYRIFDDVSDIYRTVNKLCVLIMTQQLHV